VSDRLHSHPHLFLQEHLDQIDRAVGGIWGWHSRSTATDHIRDLAKLLVRVHDLGKGTAAFQEYIKDPPHYTGDSNEKAHAPLSLLLTLAIAQVQGWRPLDTLTVAMAARGHHGRLPTLPEKGFTGVKCADRDLDNLTIGDRPKYLRRQLQTIDFAALARESGISLQDLTVIQDLVASPNRSIIKCMGYLDDEVIPDCLGLDEDEAIDYRLQVQLIYSVLLEADKAFLAVSDPEQYLKRERRPWRSAWVDEKIGTPKDTFTNHLRQQSREELIRTGNADSEERIFSLTAPTGIGKTMLAATWALQTRERMAERTGETPKLIIVLPFLSVIDQTIKEYRELLRIGNQESDSSWLMACHSLADRYYANWLEEKDAPFFIDTWRSEVIITTYDQFLLSLMDTSARYQMRFHNLCDAIIVMDEVQSLPCKLWQPLNHILQSLTRIGNSRILLMSATLPPFVEDTKPLLPNYQHYFSAFKRYKIVLRLGNTMRLNDFCEEIEGRLPGWIKSRSRVLITLNTRKSARKVMDGIDFQCKQAGMPLHFISADVTPGDRMEKILEIKTGQPCIVVSTQCIEAGVDIDMDLVIRDFGPLDSIVQIAGRCNREGDQGRCIVEVVDLVDENDHRFSEMIYDDFHLQATWDVINGIKEIPEEEILELTERYFEKLYHNDIGMTHLKRFARWQDDDPVQELLRGKERQQITFLVLDEDPTLKEEMASANKIEDRWQRREAWRKLSGRIAMVSVNVFASFQFRPDHMTDPYLGHNILRPGYYSPQKGLQVEGETMIW
jgi:CRISPR-associated endonuclease/helicase Cas3